MKMPRCQPNHIRSAHIVPQRQVSPAGADPNNIFKFDYHSTSKQVIYLEINYIKISSIVPCIAIFFI
ncbi:uncharacterized protein PHALS_15023 [Plasmopara halstedii]|uniref:Uncharacterized protein n=1 Tax=Plasmopara halstedii TaxID=4781 RepID=A0A0P1A9N9_PLAHL|nr:uncharacterized protein PHALS_15023 [Plasmopara halstedii]CEG37103.1 hypothetical protein PHALS_15023 [Plasmopara halstedii]|eukprot:XP_024573472.1 hypothetical protein PHALS_15023 [Plasmopara halstedii]